MGERALIFQVKERDPEALGSKQTEERWFARKVVKKATRQIRDTLRYLSENQTIAASNTRGQSVNLELSSVKTLYKIVVYDSSNDTSRPKSHVSSTSHFIHLISAADYEGVVTTLCTLAELFEYLEWRERVLVHYPDIHALPEQSLLGNYLWGDTQKKPCLDDLSYVFALEDDSSKWDMGAVLHKFFLRCDEEDLKVHNYHRIIGQVAQLNRNGLQSFKDRFFLCVHIAKEDSFALPYRFTELSTGCGFIFIPLQRKWHAQRRTALVNLTRDSMYDQKLDHSVGMTFIDDPDGWLMIDWCYIQEPWTHDPAQEDQLAKFYRFRPMSEKGVIATYSQEKLFSL